MTPSGEVLRRADWCVLPVSLATCQRLVAAHHYAGAGSKTATYRHGLFRRDTPYACWGVAWWIPPTRDAAIATWDGDPNQVMSLSRLVLVPDAPRNAASYLIAQSVRLIAADHRYRCLVTYADTWAGHTGGIYRAAGWEYMGLTAPERNFVDATGCMVARKAGGHTRTHEEMAALGCTLLGYFPKHKFRLILPPARPRRGLFTAMEVPA